MPDVTAYSLDRKILYIALSNGEICQIAMNSDGILTRHFPPEDRLGMISKFDNLKTIVPFKTWFNQDYLLTIRSYLASGRTKSMLNIYDVAKYEMISNENNLVAKNNFSHPEVNDACLIDSGIEKYS